MKTIVSKILGVSKSFVEFIWPLITKQVGASLAALLPIAFNIVKDLANKNELTNSQKRKEAFKLLSEATKAEGLTAASSLLNLAIEMAVTTLKANTEKE